MADVFISYKQEERERMRPIANALIELGLEVWFDARLVPGKAFTEEIVGEIDTCRAMIVCWSPKAIASEFVRGEADIGRQRGVLVPVMIEPCRLVPPFNMLHAESLIGWNGRSDHDGWHKVLRALSRHVGRELGGASSVAPRRQTPTPPALPPPHPAPLPPKSVPLLVPEMVRIPPGRFLMGSHGWAADAMGTERPQHEVRINYAFELGKYAVTFAEWDAALAAGANLHNPMERGYGRGRRPIMNVSWEDAQTYIAWLNSKTAGGYRLPSEAEWEYACRAGSTTAYSTGNRITKNQACVMSEAPAPVGSHPANAFGLHDMHGNVWEWVEDAWHDNYKGAPNDGSVWSTDDTSPRVLRGGSWANDHPAYLRSAHRHWRHYDHRLAQSGFRVARTV